MICSSQLLSCPMTKGPWILSLFVFSSLLTFPLSSAWTTNVTFQLYVECLEQNRIGRPLTSVELTTWNLHNIQLYGLGFGFTKFVWQVYPRPQLAPERPERPPAEMSYYNPRYVATGQCTNLPPATCCRTVASLTSNGQFSALPSGAISALWGPAVRTLSAPQPDGCNERILNTHYDASTWAWQDTAFPPRISGASYILCPSKAMEWGWGAVLAGICARVKRRGADPVAAAAAASTQQAAWVWPDLITLDGVNYTDNRKGNLLYYDSQNRLLDLSGLV